MSETSKAYRRPDRFIFTTGEIARLLHVAPRSVSKWIDSGLLVGYILPASQDRRVTREELVKFLHRHGMPPLTTLEDWAIRPEAALDFDRRVRARDDAIRASGVTACSCCGKPFSDHPGTGQERRVCNGDLVRI